MYVGVLNGGETLHSTVGSAGRIHTSCTPMRRASPPRFRVVERECDQSSWEWQRNWFGTTCTCIIIPHHTATTHQRCFWRGTHEPMSAHITNADSLTRSQRFGGGAISLRPKARERDWR